MPDSTSNFSGLRVAALESRRAEEIASLITRFGGVPVVAPSMREVPPSNNRDAVDFANRLMTGQIDVVLFLTGTGIRHLMSQLDRQVDRARFLASLSDVVTIARGPKPTAALKELGLTPTHPMCRWPTKWWPCRNTVSQIPVSSPDWKRAGPMSSR
jgi:uroporphyrinogen-III synthase